MLLTFEGGPWDMRMVDSRVRTPPPAISPDADDEANGIYLMTVEASSPTVSVYVWRDARRSRDRAERPDSQHRVVRASLAPAVLE